MTKIILSLLLLSASLPIIGAQYIITSNNYASVISKVENFYLNVIAEQIPQALESTVFEPIAKTIDNKTIAITKILFKEIIYDGTSPYVVLESNIISFSPNLIKTVFTFKYKIKEKGASTEGEALLSFTIYNLIIEEKENQEKHIPNVKVTIEDKPTNYEIESLDLEIEKVPEEITKAIVLYFPSINFNLLQNAMSSAINQYYIEDISKQPSSSFYLSKAFGELMIRNDMSSFTGFCTDFGKVKKTGQCFHSGNINEILDYNIKEDPLSNPSFISDDKYFQIFVNFKLFQEIFNHVVGLPVKVYLNDQTKPIGYHYSFIVANLIPFFPSLASSFIGRYPFSISAVYTSLQMKEKSTLKINISHAINIKENDTKMHYDVIQFESEIVFEFAVISEITNINLCLKKRRSLSIKMKKGKDNPFHKLVNIQEFRKEYEKIISMYLKQEPICLGKEDGLNLDEHIKFIDFSEVNDKGIFLKGEPMFK